MTVVVLGVVLGFWFGVVVVDEVVVAVEVVGGIADGLV